jgi:Zn-dependent protease
MSTTAEIFIVAVPLLISMILHEIAHGLVAERLGDPTARLMGRITLNPLKHIDPVMTILVPGMLIAAHSPVVLGGAKPVPVNARNFRNPRRGMGLVAIAGPITNIVLALIFVVLFRLSLAPAFAGNFAGPVVLIAQGMCQSGVVINIVLAVFNMLPVPPLDGGRVLTAILPEALAKAYAKIERFGLLIVLILLYTGVIGHVIDPLISFLYSVLFGQRLE